MKHLAITFCLILIQATVVITPLADHTVNPPEKTVQEVHTNIKDLSKAQEIVTEEPER